MDSIPQILTSAGLVLDIFGASLLFVYGSPQPSFEEADVVIIENAAIAEKSKKLKKQYLVRSRVGLALLILGFTLQLLASWCK